MVYSNFIELVDAKKRKTAASKGVEWPEPLPFLYCAESSAKEPNRLSTEPCGARGCGGRDGLGIFRRTQDRLNLSVGVALGSASQMVPFVAPVLVLLIIREAV